MKLRNAKKIVKVIMILTVLVFTVKVTQAEEPPPLKIGIVTSLTGVASPWGIPSTIVNKWVVDKVNKEGGIKSMGGAKLELFISDCESDPKKAATEVEKMITLHKPHAMMSVIASFLTKVAMPIVERHKIPMVGVEQSDELFDMKNKWFFGIGPKVSIMGRGLVDVFVKAGQRTGQPMKRVAILCQDGTFGETSSDTLGKYLPKKGFKVVANEIYPTGKVSDFSNTIAKFKALKADALICSATPPEAALIARAMKATNFNPLAYGFCSTVIDMPDFINLGKDRDFAMGTPVFSIEEVGEKIEGAKDIIQEFYSDISEKERKLCSEKDVLERLCAIGVVIHAFERAKSYDPAAIRDAIEKLDLGVGDRFIYWPDRVKFDEGGWNYVGKPMVAQYQNMKMKILYPESMVSPDTKAVWPIPEWSER